MNILKHAEEHGENIVVVGATGLGKTTNAESLMAFMSEGGHPGVRVSLGQAEVVEGMERLRTIIASDCAEIVVPSKS